MKYTDESKDAVQHKSMYIPRGHRLWVELEIDKAEESGEIDPYVEPVPSADEIFSNAIQPLVFGISQVERDTFERQEREALEWISDNEAPVKFIRDLAEARGITIDGLVSKIIKKADAYSEHLAKALGEKHKAEDEIPVLVV